MGNDVQITVRDEDWGTTAVSTREKTTPCVVLRDRLMTDAALGGPRPIKSEHSYSLLASSPPASPAIPENGSTATPRTLDSAVKTSQESTTLINGQQVLVLRNRIDGEFIKIH